MHKNQGSGGLHGLQGAWRLRFDAFVHLAGNGCFHIKVALFTPLPQGVGPCGHRLGLQCCERPTGWHLAAHHTGQIRFDAQPVDGHHATAPGQKHHITAIAPLAKPEPPRIVCGHSDGWGLTEAIQNK